MRSLWTPRRRASREGRRLPRSVRALRLHPRADGSRGRRRALRIARRTAGRTHAQSSRAACPLRPRPSIRLDPGARRLRQPPGRRTYDHSGRRRLYDPAPGDPLAHPTSAPGREGRDRRAPVRRGADDVGGRRWRHRPGAGRRRRLYYAECEEAEDAGGLIYLWPRQGAPIVLPTRALAEGEAARLVARIKAQIGRGRP